MLLCQREHCAAAEAKTNKSKERGYMQRDCVHIFPRRRRVRRNVVRKFAKPSVSDSEGFRLSGAVCFSFWSRLTVSRSSGGAGPKHPGRHTFGGKRARTHFHRRACVLATGAHPSLSSAKRNGLAFRRVCSGQCGFASAVCYVAIAFAPFSSPGRRRDLPVWGIFWPAYPRKCVLRFLCT